ncbi:MAG: hypothetical protein M1554_00395 [Patescibacteria group bacterium]|jgi:hypothetical protein|nr:hypothetical protein [Patescibacteria group bacterium]
MLIFLDYIILLVLLFVIVYFGLRRYKSKLINPKYYLNNWLRLVSYLKQKKLWYKAVIDADKLLDEALTKAHYKGNTVGEKLVSAQKQLKSSEEIWFAHKLAKRITEDNANKFTKKEIVKALTGFRDALVQLDALRVVKKSDESRK